MDPDDLKQREIGFMVGVGLLLNSSESVVRSAIKGALNLPPGDLAKEIESGDYSRNATYGPINPCKAGWHWDYELGLCVPD